MKKRFTLLSVILLSCSMPQVASADQERISAEQAIRELSAFFAGKAELVGRDGVEAPCEISVLSLEGRLGGLQIRVRSHGRTSAVEVLGYQKYVTKTVTDYANSVRYLYGFTEDNDYALIEIDVRKTDGAISVELVPFESQNMATQHCGFAG